MSSKRKKYRADGGFVQLTRQVTRSSAFRSLSSRAVALLIDLMDRYYGQDNRVSMSRREAAEWLKTGSHQVADAFAELERKGFIRCYERGGFTRKVRHATVWTLTMFGRGGQKATLDFLCWAPEDSKCGCRAGTNTGARAAPMRAPVGANAMPVSERTGATAAPVTSADAIPHVDSARGEGPLRSRQTVPALSHGPKPPIDPKAGEHPEGYAEASAGADARAALEFEQRRAQILRELDRSLPCETFAESLQELANPCDANQGSRTKAQAITAGNGPVSWSVSVEPARPSGRCAAEPKGLVQADKFEKLWELQTFPNQKRARGKAEEKWAAAMNRGTDPNLIIRKFAEAQRAWIQHQCAVDEIPPLATWLFERRWLRDPHRRGVT